MPTATASPGTPWYR